MGIDINAIFAANGTTSLANLPSYTVTIEGTEPLATLTALVNGPEEDYSWNEGDVRVMSITFLLGFKAMDDALGRTVREGDRLTYDGRTYQIVRARPSASSLEVRGESKIQKTHAASSNARRT